VPTERVESADFWPSRVVYDLTEKIDSSLDSIEKNIAESDLVYVLTEIDSQRQRPIGQPCGRNLHRLGQLAVVEDRDSRQPDTRVGCLLLSVPEISANTG
jgi:hypothetical protein